MIRAPEDAYEILADGRLGSVRDARRFPPPRTERVLPGHLVAIATTSDGSEVLVVRWYRNPSLLSADLPGDEMVGRRPAAEHANVELDKVARLYTEHCLWDDLA